MTVDVVVPRANANEDELQLINIAVADGTWVDGGALLFVLETTKAAVEVEAPVAGYVRMNGLEIGDYVRVGSTLCAIADVRRAERSSTVSESAETPPKITAKARRLASLNGLDLGRLQPVNGRIGEAEVRSALAERDASPASDREGGLPRPAVLTAPSRRAVVLGGGGHAACVLDGLKHSGFEIVGCLDPAFHHGHEVLAGVKVIGTEADLQRLRGDGVTFAFVGIGGAESSTARRDAFLRLRAEGFLLPPVIHPQAIVSPDSKIGSGAHVLAGATIGPRCFIGDNVIVNQGSIVCHDTSLRDHVHIAPGAVLAGGVDIGEMTVIGMCCTVLFGTTIGSDCLVHNGSRINSNVPDGTVVMADGQRRNQAQRAPAADLLSPRPRDPALAGGERASS